MIAPPRALPGALALLIGASLLPRMAAWIAGPLAIAEPPGFSWPVFTVGAVLVAAAVVAFGLRVIRTPSTPVATAPLRWWGWLSIAGLIVSWTLAWTRLGAFVPVQGLTYTPLWMAYLGVMGALAQRRHGDVTLLERPARFFAITALSVPFWWLFEAFNEHTRNWAYDIDSLGSTLDIVLYGVIPFTTVLPAVLLTREWLATFPRLEAAATGWPVWRLRSWRVVAWASVAAALVTLALLPVFPNELYPFEWLSPVLLLGGLRTLQGAPHTFSRLPDGDAREPVIWGMAALVAGLCWELWNSLSRSRWTYMVPYLDGFHVFEMPLLGYAGYVVFGWFCADMMRLVPGLTSSASQHRRPAQPPELFRDEPRNACLAK
jgi:hypothetical protein